MKTIISTILLLLAFNASAQVVSYKPTSFTDTFVRTIVNAAQARAYFGISGDSTNSALLNGTNVFTGTNRFSSVVIATNTGSIFAGNNFTTLAASAAGVAIDATAGSVRSLGALRANFLNSYDNGVSIIGYAGNYIQIYDGAGGNAIRIDSSGNVGVGTTSAASRLQVIGTGLTIGTAGTAVTNYASATATLNFASIATHDYEDLTITVTGAVVNDTVTLGLPATVLGGVVYNAWVSAANTVTVRCNNFDAGPKDPASATYRVGVISH